MLYCTLSLNNRIPSGIDVVTLHRLADPPLLPCLNRHRTHLSPCRMSHRHTRFCVYRRARRRARRSLVNVPLGLPHRGPARFVFSPFVGMSPEVSLLVAAHDIGVGLYQLTSPSLHRTVSRRVIKDYMIKVSIKHTFSRADGEHAFPLHADGLPPSLLYRLPPSLLYSRSVCVYIHAY